MIVYSLTSTASIICGNGRALNIQRVVHRARVLDGPWMASRRFVSLHIDDEVEVYMNVPKVPLAARCLKSLTIDRCVYALLALYVYQSGLLSPISRLQSSTAYL